MKYAHFCKFWRGNPSEPIEDFVIRGNVAIKRAKARMGGGYDPNAFWEIRKTWTASTVPRWAVEAACDGPCGGYPSWV
jgi:hypothetical protein